MERQQIIFIFISALLFSCNSKNNKEHNLNILNDSYQLVCLKDKLVTSLYNEENNIHTINIYSCNFELVDKIVFFQEPLPIFSIDEKKHTIDITYINLSKTKTLNNTLDYYLKKKKTIANFNINYIINNKIEGEYLKSKKIFDDIKFDKNNCDISFYNKLKIIKTINIKELIFSKNQNRTVLEYSSGITNKINNKNILIPENDTLIDKIKKEILKMYIKN